MQQPLKGATAVKEVGGVPILADEAPVGAVIHAIQVAHHAKIVARLREKFGLGRRTGWGAVMGRIARHNISSP